MVNIWINCAMLNIIPHSYKNVSLAYIYGFLSPPSLGQKPKKRRRNLFLKNKFIKTNPSDYSPILESWSILFFCVLELPLWYFNPRDKQSSEPWPYIALCLQHKAIYVCGFWHGIYTCITFSFPTYYYT